MLNLSKGVSDRLQSDDLDIVTGCDRVKDLLVAIKEMRNETCFGCFWDKSTETCDQLNIRMPGEERQRKIPKRIDDRPQTAVQLPRKERLRAGFFYSVRELKIFSILIYAQNSLTIASK